jgi:hypothetical protein
MGGQRKGCILWFAAAIAVTALVCIAASALALRASHYGIIARRPLVLRLGDVSISVEITNASV